MSDEYYNKLESLRKANEHFVEAVVVRREVPSSGKSGDKAVIDKHGEVTGWIGGGCVQGIVHKEAEDALKTGKPRLVRVGDFPASEPQEGVKEYKMTCMSEGTVEIFIDPYLPAPHLIVLGKSQIARSLVKIAKAAGYRVTAVAVEAKADMFDQPDELIAEMSLANVDVTSASAIVAATQGEEDEKALELLMSQPCFYKGFVASRKKMSGLVASVSGFTREQIDSIHNPSGIDINAKKPEEVSISILAEIIQARNRAEQTGFTGFETEGNAESKFYINPVCGVPVDRTNAKHVVDFKGEKVFFCCDGCKVSFDKEPEKYMSGAVAPSMSNMAPVQIGKK